MYRTYNARPIPRAAQPKRSRKPVIITTLIFIILLGYTGYALARPLDAARVTIVPPVVPAQTKVNIPWPADGQAAFGADGYGVLASKAAEKPVPMASVTKVITALAVLEKKPLKLGEQGPVITLTAEDVSLYNKYFSMDGAVVPVAAGGTMTQYQALQALLLPSANNIADTLVLWAFGSMESYTRQANLLVDKLDMTQTNVSDASGFSPLTVSTPSDLIKLGDASLDNPIIAEIIAQQSAVFPGVGEIRNVNNFLGQSGIRGIKTGSTEEAGGCYLAAADIMVGNQKITVIAAVMGASTRPEAMRGSLPLIQSAPAQFRTVNILKAGQEVGTVVTKWGEMTSLVAEKDISVTPWNGTAVSPKAVKKPVQAPATQNTSAGELTMTFNNKLQTAKLYTKTSLSGPSVWWRLTNPL